MTVVSDKIDRYVINGIGTRKIFLNVELDNLTPKARRTRAALIDAARSLIGREGTTGVNVMTVCAEANVGRTSFYNYFEDIDVLISAVALEAAADIKARFDQMHEEQPRGRERLRNCLDMMLSLAGSDHDTVLLLTSLAHTTPEISAMMETEIAAELRAESPATERCAEPLARYLTVATLALARHVATGTIPKDDVDQYLEFLLRACDEPLK